MQRTKSPDCLDYVVACMRNRDTWFVRRLFRIILSRCYTFEVAGETKFIFAYRRYKETTISSEPANEWS